MTNDYQLAPVSSNTELGPVLGQAPEPAQPARNPLLVLHGLLRGRYIWAVPLALVLAAGAAFVAYRYFPLKYQSTGLVQIRPYIPGILKDQAGVMPMFEAFAESQAQLMRSRRTIDMAMQNPEWAGLGRGVSPQTVTDFTESLAVARPKGGEMVLVNFTDPDPTAAMIAVASIIQAYQALYGENDIQSIESRIQVLEGLRTRHTAELDGIRKRIDGIGAEFGSNKLEQQYQFKVEELNKLESQLKQVQLNLAIAEAALGQAATQPSTQPAETMAPATQPAELTDEVVAAVDPIARDALRRLRSLQHRLEWHLQTKGENHRDVKQTRFELATAEAELGEAVRFFRDAVAKGLIPNPLTSQQQAPGAPVRAIDLAPLRSQQQKLLALYEREKQATMELGRKNMLIESLRVEEENVRIKLDEVKARIETLNLESAGSGRIVVISRGDRPVAPSNDKRIPVAGASGFGGFAIGIGLAVLVGLMDRRFRSIGDARTSLRHVNRILGILPSLPDDLSDPEQMAIAAHCVHHIRTLLQIHAGRADQHVFAVTSPASGDGKTSLTLALGLSFAACECKTLLIDCDVIGGGLTARVDTIIRRKLGQVLRRQGLLTENQLKEALAIAQHANRRLGEVLIEMGYLTPEDVRQALSIQNESVVGLVDVLAGENLMDCVITTGTPGLCVLPLGAADTQHVGQLSPAVVRRILNEARQHFDVILIDTGPILGSLEAAIVAAEADEVILTVSRGEQRLPAERAIEHLGNIGARIAGIVFNRAQVDDIASSGYSSAVSTRFVSNRALVPAGAGRFGPVASAVVTSAQPENGEARKG